MAKNAMGPIEERYRDGEVTVEQWSERDRSFIGIQEVDTTEYLAAWWDEDVLQMFEDGFFEPGRLEMSVIEYADEIGIPPYFKRKQKKKKPVRNPIITGYRIGDFVEFFKEDAKIASKIMGLAKTRAAFPYEPILIAGFPYHAILKYEPMLAKAGYHLEVQEKKPEFLKKRRR